MTSEKPSMTRLKLAALDEEDLKIISAHMQDALLTVGDMAFLPRKARFALVASRFDWPGHVRGEGRPRRARTGLHFERVLEVRTRNIRRQAKDGVLSLLAITFTPDDEPPGGTVEMVFSGGGSIRLRVECLEAWMEDIGPVWEAGAIPSHEDE